MLQYDRINMYTVIATLEQPMHIGLTGGTKEILFHPVTGIPFIQASSLAGAFRSFYRSFYDADPEDVKNLFGDERKESSSRISFSDGEFIDTVQLERRGQISMKNKNGVTGGLTCPEHLRAGLSFRFNVYVYEDTRGKQGKSLKDWEIMFSALHSSCIQIGGYKSVGCGSVSITKLLKQSFDMTNKSDREAWRKAPEYLENGEELQVDEIIGNKAYEIIVRGSTEGGLLVADFQKSGNGHEAADRKNIQNAAGEYIIPGGSLKGVLCSRIKMYAEYYKLEQKEKGWNDFKIVEDIFGGLARYDGKIGNTRFHDTVVGNKEDNDKVMLRRHIHIDRFTGGARFRKLYSRKLVYGDVNFKIDIMKLNNPTQSCGFLLLALRDLAAGVINIGSGYGVGNGFIRVDEIEVKTENAKAVLRFKSENGKPAIEDEDGIIKKCMVAVGKAIKEAQESGKTVSED